jgi:hypothetical protein
MKLFGGVGRRLGLGVVAAHPRRPAVSYSPPSHLGGSMMRLLVEVGIGVLVVVASSENHVSKVSITLSCQ